MCYKIMFCKKKINLFDQREALSASSGIFGLLYITCKKRARSYVTSSLPVYFFLGCTHLYRVSPTVNELFGLTASTFCSVR